MSGPHETSAPGSAVRSAGKTAVALIGAPGTRLRRIVLLDQRVDRCRARVGAATGSMTGLAARGWPRGPVRTAIEVGVVAVGWMLAAPSESAQSPAA